jgi:hypothetical protein
MLVRRGSLNFSFLFSRCSSPDETVLGEIVGKLVTLCATLNEYPHVRYNRNSALGTRVARDLQAALDVRKIKDRNSSGGHYLEYVSL